MWIWLTGCTQNIPYRDTSYTNVPSCPALYKAYDDDPRAATDRTLPESAAVNSCWGRPKEEHDVYDLLFVEFDDQGWVQGSSKGSTSEKGGKKDHLNDFFETLDRLYAEQQKNGSGLSLVVFLHGWHHNAGVTDRNVHSFRRFLREIASMEKRRQKEHKDVKRVVGIYVGWRGESVTIPFINALTFWDRKNTAERVAQGSIRELLARLDYMRDSKRDRYKKDKRTVRMLTIGHSFGGLIAFESMSSEFLRNALRYKESKENEEKRNYVSRFGDLVVIVNPAFDGARYEPLRAATQRMDNLEDNQLPVLIVAQSNADWANGIFFPLARAISTIFESQPDVEFDATTKSVGHNERYITHDLGLCQSDDMACMNVCRGHASPAKSDEIRDATRSEIVDAEYIHMRDIAENGYAKGQERHYLCGGLELKGTKRWQPAYNPFWVVSTTKDIMRNHGDIFNVNFTTFVRQMYLSIIAARFDPDPRNAAKPLR